MNIENQKFAKLQKQKWLFHLFVVAVILTLVPAAAHAKGGHAKLSADLTGFPVNPDGTVDVIIQFNQTPKAQHFADLAAHGGRMKCLLEYINGAADRIPVKALVWLQNHPDVAYVTPDRPNKVAWNNGSGNGPDDDVPAVMDDVATQQFGLDGTGVGIAIIDSGV